MDIKKLKAFAMVAEFGSFSRAAAVLGVVQPMLSRQVRALEEELGVQLVHRNGRGIVLVWTRRLRLLCREDLAASIATQSLHLIHRCF